MVRKNPRKISTRSRAVKGDSISSHESEIKRARFLEDARSAAASTDLGREPYSQEVMTSFVSTVLKKVEERYIRQHSGTHLVGQLRDSLRFLHSRGSAETKVRVFRPSENEHGYELNGTVLETLLPDQPFVFDTIRIFLHSRHIRVKNAMNVVLRVARSASGNVERVSSGSKESEGSLESYCRFYMEGISEDVIGEVEESVRRHLTLAQTLVRDFGRMTKITMDLRTEYKLLRTVFKGHTPYLDEAQQFLEWLADGHFVFMGASIYEASSEGVKYAPESSLGVMTCSDSQHRPNAGDDETLHMLRLNRPIDRYFLQVRKSNSESVIHRTGKIDEVVIRRFDLDGTPLGGVVLHGLFTHKAISSPGGTIPILQKKLQDILEREEAVSESYEYKAIVDAFNSLPVEYLFTGMTAGISRLIRSLLRSEREQSVQHHLDVNMEGRTAFLFVVIPHLAYSDDMRSRLQAFMMESLGATYCDHRVLIGKTDSVIIHLYLTGDVDFREEREEVLAPEILAICSPWGERLHNALAVDYAEDHASELLKKYEDGFSDGYKAIRSVSQAVTDISFAEEVLESGELRFDLNWEERETAQLVFYEPQNLFLTDILPILDHFGLRVREQEAFTLRLNKSVVIDSFFVEGSSLPHGREPEGKKRLLEALRAVFTGRVTDDPLNRLVSITSMNWEEVDVVRGYLGYSRQLMPVYTPQVVRQVLLDNPVFAELLVRAFRVRFSPEFEGSNRARKDAFSTIENEVKSALQGIASFSQDRILKMLFNLVKATLRTNFYRDDRLFHYISFKLDCAAVEEMTDPRPWREIYVHHVSMEGIHMRGGAVARGGIRWSDRLDDYRSEVLGLMTTQMVKNTLIVPVGAKGGFVLKRGPADGNVRRFADEMYTFFIRGLLDLSDNRVDGVVVPPSRVVRHDAEDPYLVVAADKGTAHLSDTANAISEEYGFWLGDAFGSGGSTGYDHKVEGITAKGAWVCARRHFYEMDMDPEKDAVRVAGIGDMSGDVFGNGMLLSQTMKLQAAFNHIHIFLDPNPHPKKSFAERKRLFETPRSTWEDYKTSLISKGGGVFPRQSKEIALSPEVQEMLGVQEEVLSGEALIKKILQMDVDLLWNGGIGTYLKSPEETDADVSDKSNDAVRVNAAEVRASVFGEGGNLGATKAGRVAYHLQGGRINTDAVDNAGGVNLSDREVNLKVLFSPLVRANKITLDERNTVLQAATQEVDDKVLHDNELQSLRISLDQIRSKRDIDVFARCQNRLVVAEILNSTHEVLPTAEVLYERREAEMGYARPELSILGAYVKMSVYRALLECNLSVDEWDRSLLNAYFPAVISKSFSKALDEHMLRHEILCTIKTNLIVDFAGASFFTEMMERTDRSIGDVAFAYLAVHEILDTWKLKVELLELQKTSKATGIYPAMLFLEDVLRKTVVWLLGLYPAEELSLLDSEACAGHRKTLTAVLEAPNTLFNLDVLRQTQAKTKEIARKGVPKRVGEMLSRLDHGVGTLPILLGTSIHPMSDRPKRSWDETVMIWDALDAAFGFRALENRLLSRTSGDKWEAIALLGLANLFSEVHCSLGVKMLALVEGNSVKGIRKAVQRLVHDRSDLNYLSSYLKEASREVPSVPKLLVLGDRLKTAVRQLQI